MARLAGCINALVENNVRVDEDMVTRAYEACIEMSFEDVEYGKLGADYLGGERGRRVVEMALGAMHE